MMKVSKILVGLSCRVFRLRDDHHNDYFEYFLQDVRKVSTRFEYFLARFAQVADLAFSMVDPDAEFHALSNGILFRLGHRAKTAR